MVAPPEAWQIRNKNLNFARAFQDELELKFGPGVYVMGGGQTSDSALILILRP